MNAHALTALKLTGIAFGAMSLGLLFMGLGRIVSARIQRRIGPPFYQSFIDVIKCFTKTSITHNFVMDLGIIMALGGLIATAFFVPFANFSVLGSSSVVIVLYLMSIGYLGMAMGVSASGNPNATIGISRALALMLGYKIPFVMVIMAMILTYNSSDLLTYALAQNHGFGSWHIFKYPLGFIAVEIAFQAMVGEKPYDHMIAPAEIASGPMVELSGKYLGIGFLLHAVQLYVETGLIVNLFLGGAQTWYIMMVKMFAVYFTTMCINAVMARYRIEQGIRHLWIWAGSFALLQLVYTRIWG
ncbi:NADH-quinone oxidoreductase subunit H [Myxococcota bacterium]|nr:NADH-quinone oxidoreductase subunit H [Myxococcota bacterium]MBU1383054.1 NADH-quinone oxidoreductase subunit H [Myxococcota bacterium]MBU1497609.1 NADH-quinone oxidoreductase subunit H [Myxococcota bacterium]